MSLHNIVNGGAYTRLAHGPEPPLNPVWGYKDILSTSTAAQLSSSPYTIIRGTTGSSSFMPLLLSGAMMTQKGQVMTVCNKMQSGALVTANTGVFYVSSSATSSGSYVVGGNSTISFLNDSNVPALIALT